MFRSLVGAGDDLVLGVPGGEVVQTPLAAGQTRAVLTHSRALGALRRSSQKDVGSLTEILLTSHCWSCLTMRDLTVSQVWGMLQLITQEACQGYLEKQNMNGA